MDFIRKTKKGNYGTCKSNSTIKNKKRIVQQLLSIEKKHRVKILYACESGSRAWGFPSKDSDYDVRFIYVRPAKDYLSIEEKRDVIEVPIDDSLDLSGWDLKKTLRLFKASNPSLIEWLSSPVVYLEKNHFAARMKKLLPYVYSRKACFYHYSQMALRNAKAYLRGERVSPKKYFYVLRPLLAAAWIKKNSEPVPVLFETLLQQMLKDAKVKKEVSSLIEKKKHGIELEKGPRIKIIQRYLENGLSKFEGSKFSEVKNSKTIEKLDHFFRGFL